MGENQIKLLVKDHISVVAVFSPFTTSYIFLASLQPFPTIYFISSLQYPNLLEEFELPLQEKFGFCTLSLIRRRFLIIHDALQRYYDVWWSPESWSSLLTSPLVVSSHVATLKHEGEQQLLTQKRLFQLLQETNKQPFPVY